MEAKVVAQDEQYQLISVPKREWELVEELLKLPTLTLREMLINRHYTLDVASLAETIDYLIKEDELTFLEPGQIPYLTDEVLLNVLSIFAKDYTVFDNPEIYSQIEMSLGEVLHGS